MPDYDNRNSALQCLAKPKENEVNQSSIDAQNSLGNQCIASRVEGITGRTFNRILGEGDSATDTENSSFGTSEVRRYLDEQLQFANDEWFRGTKLDGAAQALVEELDHNGDGRVDWAEFQTYRQQMLASLAPGVSEGASAAEINVEAQAAFGALSTDGEVSYDVLHAESKQRIDPEKDHVDLIAQLAALLVLDAADLNEKDVSPKERSLNQLEWMGAATDLSGS
jgi:hypothetical protein